MTYTTLGAIQILLRYRHEIVSISNDNADGLVTTRHMDATQELMRHMKEGGWELRRVVHNDEEAEFRQFDWGRRA